VGAPEPDPPSASLPRGSGRRRRPRSPSSSRRCSACWAPRCGWRCAPSCCCSSSTRPSSWR
jgi:hypothetical protein